MRRHAFTLVEVILSILIISGIMTVLLYFYQRAAEVRQNALDEAEFLSISRMLLEQLSTELRAARVVPDQFIGLEGTSNSISFVSTSIPQMARWITSSNDTVTLPSATDLKRITYKILGGTNTFEPGGIDRTEEPLFGPGLAALSTATNATELESGSESNLVGTNLPAGVVVDIIVTNLVTLERPLLTDRIRFFSLRYWAGTNWLESWSGLELPAGIEISLGREAMPTDATEGYPYELFRRVVYLPNSTHPSNRAIAEITEESPL